MQKCMENGKLVASQLLILMEFSHEILENDRKDMEFQDMCIQNSLMSLPEMKFRILNQFSQSFGSKNEKSDFSRSDETTPSPDWALIIINTSNLAHLKFFLDLIVGKNEMSLFKINHKNFYIFCNSPLAKKCHLVLTN